LKKYVLSLLKGDGVFDIIEKVKTKLLSERSQKHHELFT
jgi:hypothetical protein